MSEVLTTQRAPMSVPAELRDRVNGTPIAHLATLLPDGSPHSVPVWIGTYRDHLVIMTGPQSQKARNLRRDPRVAISLTSPDNPFLPVMVRGRVITWIDGPEGWAVIDGLAQKYIGAPYGREHERIVGVIEVEQYKVGM
jgi:PPOX class probable F420-dependent enzyme